MYSVVFPPSIIQLVKVEIMRRILIYGATLSYSRRLSKRNKPLRLAPKALFQRAATA
jgi:hypothetical protein